MPPWCWRSSAQDPDFGWTFHRAVDSCFATDKAWRTLRQLPGLDQVLTAGSARGVTEGLDELVARARIDEFARNGDHGRRWSAARARAVAGPCRRTGVPHRFLGATAGVVEGVRGRRSGGHLAAADRRRDPPEPSRPDPPCPLVIFIDPPTWPGHGRLWSHMISDTSYAELHDFAASVGIPPRAFERDHYDVIAERYESVVAAGAHRASSREIVAMLHRAGLRRRHRSALAPPLGRRWPRPLAPGDLVAVVSPVRAGGSPDRLARGVALLESWGLRVRLQPRVLSAYDPLTYLAADDHGRADGLHHRLDRLGRWRRSGRRAAATERSGWSTWWTGRLCGWPGGSPSWASATSPPCTRGWVATSTR